MQLPGETDTSPKAFLLRGTCLGCHGQGTSGNIVNSIPQVLHTNSTDLAGGNFAYITGTGSKSRTGSDQNTAGHNVVDLGSSFKDTVLHSPPGDQYLTGITNDNLTCAGIYGCHGDRTVTGELPGIKGAHHADDVVLKFGSISEGSQGGTIGLSYRFLKGVKGGEDADWQGVNPSATVHNEYKGVDPGVEGGDDHTPGGGTISGLCSECHGHFHGGSADIGGPTGTPWLRHPTDIVLPDTTGTEYLLYNGGTGSNNPYSLTAPVARGSLPGSPGAVAKPGSSGPDGAIIMCLSCHRAHASPYFKIMRWDYKGWPASGGSNGCNVCHTSKI